MNTGRLIVLCGTEGSGKTTAVQRLKKSSEADQFVFTREPGGSPNAETIRQFVLSDVGGGFSTEARFYLMWAARMIHLQETIVPALQAGKHVISDRFDCCTWAFQICAEDNGHLATLFQEARKEMQRKLFCSENKASDHIRYIHFDLPPAVGLARKSSMKDDDRNYFDEKKLGFHERVRLGYHDFAERFGMARIDADQTPDEVWQSFCSEVHKALA